MGLGVAACPMYFPCAGKFPAQGKIIGRGNLLSTELYPRGKVSHRMMTDGQTLDFEALRAEAQAAVKGSGATQRSVADQLDLAESWVSRCLNNSGPKYAGAQATIIGALTDFEVRSETVFRAVRKG